MIEFEKYIKTVNNENEEIQNDICNIFYEDPNDETRKDYIYYKVNSLTETFLNILEEIKNQN